jgi:hypothetical protein
MRRPKLRKGRHMLVYMALLLCDGICKKGWYSRRRRGEESQIDSLLAKSLKALQRRSGVQDAPATVA